MTQCLEMGYTVTVRSLCNGSYDSYECLVCLVFLKCGMVLLVF